MRALTCGNMCVKIQTTQFAWHESVPGMRVCTPVVHSCSFTTTKIIEIMRNPCLSVFTMQTIYRLNIVLSTCTRTCRQRNCKVVVPHYVLNLTRFVLTQKTEKNRNHCYYLANDHVYPSTYHFECKNMSRFFMQIEER